uniref:Transposase (putative) gypsy type domain-containing protein n=1 Tax=Triticum urartu TaxID=4572 RepID=A0A8R7TD03_TRIUA
MPPPRLWDRAIPTSFILRGLSFPLHEFFHGLLLFYGVQLHHITPNGVLHIACFIALCECFLGIQP